MPPETVIKDVSEREVIQPALAHDSLAGETITSKLDLDLFTRVPEKEWTPNEIEYLLSQDGGPHRFEGFQKLGRRLLYLDTARSSAREIGCVVEAYASTTYPSISPVDPQARDQTNAYVISIKADCPEGYPLMVQATVAQWESDVRPVMEFAFSRFCELTREQHPLPEYQAALDTMAFCKEHSINAYPMWKNFLGLRELLNRVLNW